MLALLASGVVGGLALLVLILMTTVVVFGIKFILDRNLEESAREERELREQAPDKPERKSPEAKPLYTVKAVRQTRRRAPSRTAPVYTLEPIPEREKEHV